MSAGDAAALHTHLLVERWTLDEYAMPSALFADVVDLYREDRFMRGTLRIKGKTAAPKGVTMPVLAVVDPESDLVGLTTGLLGMEASVSQFRDARGPSNMRPARSADFAPQGPMMQVHIEDKRRRLHLLEAS